MRTANALAVLAAALLVGCGSATTGGTGGHTSATTSGTGTGATGGTGSGTTASTSGGTSGNTTSSGTGSTTGSSGASDAGQGCGLRTCQSANANCGPIGDGCGGIVQCGDCPAGDFCGGGGPSRCGPTACSPTTCAAAGADCGQIADGCGGILTCGTGSCPAGQFCGGGGPQKCGAGSYVDGGSTTCHPKSCADLGATCGQVADGCGGLTANCGTCNAPDICGGSGVPNQCGSSNRPDSGVACTNLCLQQTSCPTGTTSISGKVYAPNGVDPLYNALVYVPNGAVQPFTGGVQCLTCDSQISGSPLVAVNTGPDGSFTLNDMPVGTNIPVVIQLGRWRRQLTVNTTACQNTAIPAGTFRLPKNHTEGDIPLTAMVTGNVDALECVLRKIGIADTEFGNPSDGRRIQFYLAPTESGGQGPGAAYNGSTPDGDVLVGSSSQLDKYDMVIFSCEGSQYDKSATHLANLKSYADVGGRVFATHYSYTWLYSPTTWQAAANWNPDPSVSRGGGSTTGILDTSFPKGQAFSKWLDAVGASTSPGSGKINISDYRWDVDSVISPTQRWIYFNSGGQQPVEHLTFNTPLGAPSSQQCGRVLFSDFHVSGIYADPSTYFPSECGSSTTLSAQEHVLEFMLFDLASCVTPDQGPPPPTCNPLSCAQQNIGCGMAGDGCGGTQNCGGCPQGQTCGGAGTPSQCGTPTCTPMTCADQGIVCGPAGDGCGGTLQCNSCSGGELCGGGGVANQCGTPSCTPVTCASQNAQCGAIADGCGSTVDCGTCPAGQTCGGNGVPNQCGGFK